MVGHLKCQQLRACIPSEALNIESLHMSKNQHVVPADGGWGVRGAGNSRLTSVHETQQKAINQARSIAQNQGSELLIHGRNGQIRERDSQGKDKFPPKG